MRRAERLFRLVQALRARPVNRAADLARVFEVSAATIYRDIAHLQASGLPIDGEAGVGYMLRPGFDLPAMTFTHEQVDALAVGLAFVERTGDPALAEAAAEVRAKLQAALPDPDKGRLANAPFRSLQPRDAVPALGARVRAAIRARRVLRLVYVDAAERETTRIIEPLLIITLTDGWMLSGWCRLRCGFRTFHAHRIRDLADTGERFVSQPGQGLADFLAAEACTAP